MKKPLICLVIILFPILCFAESKTEKVLSYAYFAERAVDCLQTLSIYENENLKEMNPVIDWAHNQIGKAGVVTFFAVTTFVVPVIIKALPERHRVMGWMIANTINIAIIVNNGKQGCKISLKF